MKQKLAVIALGGNALVSDDNSYHEQYKKIYETCKQIVLIIAQGYSVVITHGNGPQVGFLLRRAELASYELPIMMLDECVAATQATIGYQIQQALKSVLYKKKIHQEVITIVTQVVVDKNDHSFQNPTKPIGSFLSKAEAKKFEKESDWIIKEDAGRGYRRVVPSPKPIEIIELSAIKKLMGNDTIVIALGGGGIPVVKDKHSQLQGIEAVIDKDTSSSLLAQELNADVFIILTGVPKVYINYQKRNEHALNRVSVSELNKYARAGHFSEGSMLPKIEAVINYVKATKGEAIITDLNNLSEALKGRQGTIVTALKQ